MLHEMCHLIHQHALPDGLDNVGVKETFAIAKESGCYDQVLRRDWAGKDVDCDLAYAMVDHREFFAEMSVTFWSRGYRELDREPNYKMEKASPPIIAPSVQSNIAVHHQTLGKFVNAGKLVQVGIKTVPHCNKFYPFTCGQLQSFDRITYQSMEKLWHTISLWEDPLDRECCSTCWYPRISKQVNVVESAVSDTIEL